MGENLQYESAMALRFLEADDRNQQNRLRKKPVKSISLQQVMIATVFLPLAAVWKLRVAVPFILWLQDLPLRSTRV